MCAARVNDNLREWVFSSRVQCAEWLSSELLVSGKTLASFLTQFRLKIASLRRIQGSVFGVNLVSQVECTVAGSETDGAHLSTDSAGLLHDLAIRLGW